MDSSRDVRIRLALRDDVGALLALIRELAEYEQLADAVKVDAALLETALFDDEVAEALIAEVGEEVAGYAVFFTTFSTFECKPGLWVEDLFVRPAQRRRGIGAALLAQIAAIAVEGGCARLEWSALHWNEPALRFYDGLGAERLEQWQMLRLEGDALTRLGGG
jgi:GNAT superfamily N-acetyltransferase